jgi:hypothetical protein
MRGRLRFGPGGAPQDWTRWARAVALVVFALAPPAVSQGLVVPAVVAPCDSLSPNQQWVFNASLTVTLFGEGYCLAPTGGHNGGATGDGVGGGIGDLVPMAVAAFSPCPPDTQHVWVQGPNSTWVLEGTSLCLAVMSAPLTVDMPVEVAPCGAPGSPQQVCHGSG